MASIDTLNSRLEAAGIDTSTDAPSTKALKAEIARRVAIKKATLLLCRAARCALAMKAAARRAVKPAAGFRVIVSGCPEIRIARRMAKVMRSADGDALVMSEGAA